MEDFYVFGNNLEVYLTNLGVVLERCQQKSLLLIWEKNHFIVRKGIALSYIVSYIVMEIDNVKVEFIFKILIIKIVKNIHSFLGYVGFHRRLIKILVILLYNFLTFFNKMCI